MSFTKIFRQSVLIAVIPLLMLGVTVSFSLLSTDSRAASPLKKVGDLPGISLWRWQERYIRLVAKEPSAPPNDHPVRLSPKQVGVMLGELKVKKPLETAWFFRNEDEVDDGIELLFSDKELAILSDAISRGLIRAKPNEDIAFFTSSNFDLAFGGFVKERSLNTGRVFFKDGHLNIIFGEVHGEYPEDKGAGALVTHEAREPVLAWRKEEANHIWELRLEPGVTLREGRTDWVILDEDSAMVRYEERKRLRLAKENVPEAIAQGTEKIADDQEALRKKVEDLERLIRGMPPTPAGQQAAAPTSRPQAAQPAPVPAEFSKGSVEYMERRLEILKNLKEQGLIPEEVYQKQVQEILNQGF